MSGLAFQVGLPALLFGSLATADLGLVFRLSALVSGAAIGGAIALYLLVSAVAWRHTPAGRTMAALLAGYPSAGSVGIPMAAYILGGVTWLAPVLLIQTVLIQPVALAIFDATEAGEAKPRRWWQYLALPFTNAVTDGVVLGLLLNVTGLALPGFLLEAVQDVGGLAVPLMLLAFGASFHLEPHGRPSGGEAAESWFLIACKLLVSPAIAFGLAWVLGLDAEVTRAVTVVACLPPAQNIFVFAARYDIRLAFTRDTLIRTPSPSIV
jgi:predicted permease